jgi:hypothetical protein
MAPIINRGLPRILRSGYVTKGQGEPNKICQRIYQVERSGATGPPRATAIGGPAGRSPPVYEEA